MNVQAYHLDLTIDISGLSFRGHLRIEGAPEPDDLFLNAVGLTISRARAGGIDLPVRSDPDHQEVVLTGLPSGATSVEIEYDGKVLTDKLVGLYRSRFGEGHILTTQFAATEARRLLPCVDRPDRKAVFHVSVTVPKESEVVFNTPARSHSESDGTRTIQFEPTPRMATYLLYLGIGRFDTIRGRAGQVELAAFTPPGRGEAARYALGVAERVLPEYERYYGIPYPLPKLDLIAVPEFWAGAMENWGAISFAEMALLADETTSTLRRRTIADTTAHEIAHMWFGNLVTMNWWSDIWLNESFATFASYKILDRVYPDFDSWGEFVSRWSAWAFRGDSLASTHPIFRPVDNPEAIAQIFDEISYGKGASVLRMLERFLGEEAFRRGLNTYLDRFRYANASHDDLRTALEESSGAPVRRVMTEWIMRPGLPLLVARVIGHRLTIDQRRFLHTGGHPSESWPVPVVARIDGAERRLLLEGPHTEIELVTDEPPFLNVDASGFYRVLYDLHTLGQLRERFAHLPDLDQWALVNDLPPLVVSGDLDLELYLEFLRAGESATHFAVVSQFGNSGALLRGVLFDHPAFLERYRGFLRAQTDRLGLSPLPEERATDGSLREALLTQRVWVDSAFAQSMAARFPEYDRTFPEARDAIATAYVRTGGEVEFEAVLGRFRAAKSEGEMFRLLSALTAAREPTRVARVLAMARDREMLLSLVPPAIMGAARNIDSVSVAWEWIQRNLDSFAERFQGSGRTGEVLEFVIPRAGLFHEKEVREFFRNRNVAEGEQGTTKGLELLAASIGLRKRLGLSPAARQT